MDISDAFQADAIQAADAVLSEEEADDLRSWVGALYEERLQELKDELIEGHPAQQEAALYEADVKELWLELVFHAFMAGRAYAGQTTVTVEMKSEVASLFIDFLAERVQ
jgi:hypothetical protein